MPALLLVMAGCGGPAIDRQTQSATFFAEWTQQAKAGDRDDTLCHGLGLLKFPQFSCADMLQAAAQVDPDSRTVLQFKQRDCFEGVCGTFFELHLQAMDEAGNELEETALLKLDDEVLRLYWYRSSPMLAAYAAANPVADKDAKDPEQIAYDALVAEHPDLYSYPPCYGTRPSSTNLAGELIARDDIDSQAIDALAAQCPEVFCFAFIGQKIAPLCPQR